MVFADFYLASSEILREEVQLLLDCYQKDLLSGCYRRVQRLLLIHNIIEEKLRIKSISFSIGLASPKGNSGYFATDIANLRSSTKTEITQCKLIIHKSCSIFLNSIMIRFQQNYCETSFDDQQKYNRLCSESRGRFLLSLQICLNPLVA